MVRETGVECMRLSAVRNLCVAVLIASLLGCAPARPDPQIIKLCRASAVTRARGFPANASDLGELVEECMSNRGYILRETGPRCGPDFGSAVDPNCYHRNTPIGRFTAMFER